jgi:hypothetical protein
MNTLYNLDIILGLQLTMGLPEIIICELGALVLGFTIHFFWNSKKILRINEPTQPASISDNDNWKLKYYNDMDMQERAQQQLRERLAQAQETEQILTIELEENRKELDKVEHELDIVRAQLEEVELKLAPAAIASDDEVIAEPDYTQDYLHQLKAAQEKMVEHNNSIHRLIEHTHLVEES